MSALRDAAMRHGHAHEPGFRWRGREVSRLEGLSDAVFAFAITLLVVSLEVPRDVHEMVDAMRGFVGFIFSFFLLYRLWVTQYRFFRRYGLEDRTTINLNGVLLFMVLFFVYPLKFLTSAVTRWVMAGGAHGFKPHLASSIARDPDVQALVLFYFLGSAAVVGTLGLLYRHAYRRRHALELTPHEAHRTREAYQRLFLSAGVAVAPPIGILTLTTRFELAGATLEYAILGVLALFLFRMKRAARSRPSADEAYVGPEIVAGTGDS